MKYHFNYFSPYILCMTCFFIILISVADITADDISVFEVGWCFLLQFSISLLLLKFSLSFIQFILSTLKCLDNEDDAFHPVTPLSLSLPSHHFSPHKISVFSYAILTSFQVFITVAVLTIFFTFLRYSLFYWTLDFFIVIIFSPEL
jgi:hypothetical protein